MYRIPCLLAVGFIACTSVISLTGPAAAEANCPTGSTCKCVPTKFTKCTVDAGGNQKCTQSVGEKCTVVSGPGSGKPAAARATVAQPGKGTVAQPDKGKTVRPMNVAPVRAK